MRAKITAMESGEGYTDKERRVTLKFPEGGVMYDSLKVPESALGLIGVALDMELEVEVSVRRPAVASVGSVTLTPLANGDDKW